MCRRLPLKWDCKLSVLTCGVFCVWDQFIGCWRVKNRHRNAAWWESLPCLGPAPTHPPWPTRPPAQHHREALGPENGRDETHPLCHQRWRCLVVTATLAPGRTLNRWRWPRICTSRAVGLTSGVQTETPVRGPQRSMEALSSFSDSRGAAFSRMTSAQRGKVVVSDTPGVGTYSPNSSTDSRVRTACLHHWWASSIISPCWVVPRCKPSSLAELEQQNGQYKQRRWRRLQR